MVTLHPGNLIGISILSFRLSTSRSGPYVERPRFWSLGTSAHTDSRKLHCNTYKACLLSQEPLYLVQPTSITLKTSNDLGHTSGTSAMAPDLNSINSSGRWDYSTPGSTGYDIPNIIYNVSDQATKNNSWWLIMSRILNLENSKSLRSARECLVSRWRT